MTDVRADLDDVAGNLAQNWARYVEKLLVAQLRDRHGLTLTEVMRVIGRSKVLSTRWKS